MKTYLFLPLVLVLLFNGASYAQDSVDKIFPEKLQAVGVQKLDQDVPIQSLGEVTYIKDKYANEYLTSNIQNISKLFIYKNMVPLTDNKAIDNFIRINECDYYTRYYQDEFKWKDIRKAARLMIEDQRLTYTDKFKIIVPIDLGRYDSEKKGFPLVNKTDFKDFRRVELGGNNDDICGESWDIQYFPRNVRLFLNEPFNFDFLPMDEHLAQSYVAHYADDRPEIPKELWGKAFNRVAFARIRMQLLEFQGKERSRYETEVAVMFGKIDGIDIFENADETGLLASIDFITDDPNQMQKLQDYVNSVKASESSDADASNESVDKKDPLPSLETSTQTEKSSSSM